ncbi:MAG TPA: hypothetical protein VKF36_04395 [Syntrophorhabdales bacterium]|nr:hypothetical protein [Syntrophorhabdales bacterium]
MSNNFEDRLDRLVHTSWAERESDAPRQIGKVKADAAHRGALISSGTILMIDQILARELETRAILLWQAIVRVHRITGVDEGVDLAGYFKRVFNRYLDEALKALLSVYERESQILGNMGIKISSNLTSIAELSIKKHDVEIDLYVDSLRGTSRDAVVSPANTYNFYGSVGAVQSGPASYANVVQHLAASEKQDIIDALREVKIALQNVSDRDEKETAELIELVDESVVELEKNTPNNTKLRAWFDVIAGTIQVLANAGPAYRALKTALLPLGIVLP